MAGESTNSRLTSVQIRLQNNQYTDEIPISVLASNIIYDPGGGNVSGGVNQGYSLVETLGNVNMNTLTGGGSLQSQIDNLKTNMQSSIRTIASEELPIAVSNWLSNNYSAGSGSINTDKTLTYENAVADAKAAGDLIKVSNSQPTEQANKVWIKPSVTSVTVPTMQDIENIVAPQYSSSSPYNIGDYVIYNDLLYRCITTIGTSGESWTSGHWTQVNVGNQLKTTKNTIADLVDDTLTVSGKAADAAKTGEELSNLKSDLSSLTDNGLTSIKKDISWINAYVNSYGIITNSSLSITGLVTLNAGESVRVGTVNSNITIIGSTSASSIAVGDTITKIQTTTSGGNFEEYTYTANEQINLVLCVLKSNYSLLFYKYSTELKNIKNKFSNVLDSNPIDIKNIGDYVNGTYTNAGVLTTGTSNRVRFSRFILLHKGDTIYATAPTGYKVNIARFNASTKALIEEGWYTSISYIADGDILALPVWKYSNNGDITSSEITGKVYLVEGVSNEIKSLQESMSDTYVYNTFVGGSWENNTGKLTLRNDRIRLAERIFLKAGETVHFTAHTNQWHAYSTWEKDANADYGYTLIKDYSMNGVTKTEETVSFDDDVWFMATMGETGSSDFPVSALGIVVTLERSYDYSLQNKYIETNTIPRNTFDFGAFTKGGNIVAHRGKPYAENTMKAFETCVANGTRVLEIDLAFTADNVPVLLHDTTINRTGRNADGTQIGNTINIADITYEQALQYDFGIWHSPEYAGQKIPLLKDVLLFFKRKNCCALVDLTGHTYTQTHYDIMHTLFVQTGMLNNVAINASTSQIDTYTVKYKDTPLNPSGSTNNIRTLISIANNYRKSCPLLIASGFANLADDLTFTFFSKTHELGVLTIIGFIETQQEITELFKAGCDMVYSDTITPNNYNE